MRQREFDVGDSAFVGDFFCAAGQRYFRRAARQVDDFDVFPIDAGGPAGAERFHRRFFRGPTRGQTFAEIPFALQAILDFARRKDAARERFREAFVQFDDAVDFGGVGSDSEDLHFFRRADVRSSRKWRAERPGMRGPGASWRLGVR